VHEKLNKKRKLASPNHFNNKRVQRIHGKGTRLYCGTWCSQGLISVIMGIVYSLYFTKTMMNVYKQNTSYWIVRTLCWMILNVL